jgi:hypothetical protein
LEKGSRELFVQAGLELRSDLRSQVPQIIGVSYWCSEKPNCKIESKLCFPGVQCGKVWPQKGHNQAT